MANSNPQESKTGKINFFVSAMFALAAFALLINTNSVHAETIGSGYYIVGGIAAAAASIYFFTKALATANKGDGRQ